MNGAPELLDGLRDIVMPAAPPIWPPAIGWWLVAVVAIAVTIFSWIAVSRLLTGAAKRDALRRLSHIATLPPQDAASELSSLMRRAALTKFPRLEVAGLVGRDWLEFLDRSGETDQFSNGAGRILAFAPYQKQGAEDCAETIAICRKWIAHVL